MSGTAKLNVGGELNDVVFTLAPAEHSEDRNARIARENRRARNDEFLRLATCAIAAFCRNCNWRFERLHDVSQHRGRRRNPDIRYRHA